MFEKFKSWFYIGCQVKKGYMKIRFKKVKKNIKRLNAYDSSWNEVKDSSIVCALNTTKEKYDFEVLDVLIKDATDYSWVTIRCDENDKFNIFGTFCEILGEHITEVEMK